MFSSSFFFDRRHRVLFVICLLIGFMLLGLSENLFAQSCSDLADGPGIKNYSASCVYNMHVTCYDSTSSAAEACSSGGFICYDGFSPWFFSPTGASLPYGTLGSWRRGKVVGCEGTSDDLYLFIACSSGDCFPDADGDGIPDSTDPCPNNPNPDCTNPNGDPDKDTDGDGIPDDEDPCPNNPNPDCTDPDNPPPDLPPTPEFPGEIVIGDCVVDISKITSIFKANGGVFPINWIVAFGSALRAFTQVQASQAPSIQYSFSFFGKSYEIDLHLERFNAIASYVRFVSGLLAMFYFIRFANRGFFKVITGSGT